MLSMTHRKGLALAGVLAFGSVGAPSDELPADLVVDIRIVEARSRTPDFQVMKALSFFVNTDGDGVSERQWLATIAREVPDSFLATLVYTTVRVDGSRAELEIGKRSRALRLGLGLEGFLKQGTFTAKLDGALDRSGEPQRAFEQSIELRLGQSFVVSGEDLEFSASEYLSHFRDYSDRDHRQELYGRLRDFTTFLVVVVTPRVDAHANDDVATLTLPEDVDIPPLESPLGIELVGTIELEFDLADDGVPIDARIVRSSLPEVNPRLLGEAPKWRFPEAAGKTGRLLLEVKAAP